MPVDDLSRSGLDVPADAITGHLARGRLLRGEQLLKESALRNPGCSRELPKRTRSSAVERNPPPAHFVAVVHIGRIFRGSVLGQFIEPRTLLHDLYVLVGHGVHQVPWA